MKPLKIFVVFCTILSFVLNNIVAADLMTRTMDGSWQDALILGEVISKVDQDLWKISIFSTFLQNKDKTLHNGDQIIISGLEEKIKLIQEAKHLSVKNVEIGQKYFLGVNRKDDIYVLSDTVQEITGNSYLDAKVVIDNTIPENKRGEYSAWQVFINSRGAETMFSFYKDTVIWRPTNSEKNIQIFPEIGPNELSQYEKDTMATTTLMNKDLSVGSEQEMSSENGLKRNNSSKTIIMLGGIGLVYFVTIVMKMFCKKQYNK